MTRLRRNPIPYLALLLVLAVGAGGGYALAASKTKTISVCADKRTGVLHLKTHGRCTKGQTRVTWNQQGPTGAQGVQGPAGPAGASATGAAAIVAGNGVVLHGQGITVQRLSMGVYAISVEVSRCPSGFDAPVVSISDANPPLGVSGEFPVAWVGDTGTNQTFTVNTGVVPPVGQPGGGQFMSADRTFNVVVGCA